jgi:hypothetical protein
MIVAKHLYATACDFFWQVISAWYLIFDPGEMSVNNKRVVFASLEYRATSWGSDAEELAGWVIDERRSPLKRQGLSQDERMSFIRILGEMASEAVYAEAQQLRLKTNRVKNSYKHIDESTLVYYYYCGWLLATLHEFQRILEEIVAQLSYSRQPYEQIKPTMLSLVQQLQAELDSIVQQEQIDAATAAALRQNIEVLAAELIVHWRDAVYSTVDRIAPG